MQWFQQNLRVETIWKPQTLYENSKVVILYDSIIPASLSQSSLSEFKNSSNNLDKEYFVFGLH